VINLSSNNINLLMSSPKTVTVAALQASLNADIATNVTKISELVRKAADQGAQVILPPE